MIWRQTILFPGEIVMEYFANCYRCRKFIEHLCCRKMTSLIKYLINQTVRPAYLFDLNRFTCTSD